MTRYFCTYFDNNYRMTGLTMFQSLVNVLPDIRLYVLCLDDVLYQNLQKIDSRIIPIRLTELEKFDTELTACKNNRSLIEYYFTLSPCLPLYILKMNPDISLLSYLDSDLYFFESPETAYAELGDKSIYIVPHNYSSNAEDSITKYGRFNVAFQIYRNNKSGIDCLEWWRKKCLEWCHDYVDNGRFADQKYLDLWPELFQEEVVVSTNPGINLAPWNMNHYQIEIFDNSVKINNYPLIFVHYQGFRFLFNQYFTTWPFWNDQPVKLEIWNFFSIKYYKANMKTFKIYQRCINKDFFATQQRSRTFPKLGRMERFISLLPNERFRLLCRLLYLIFIRHSISCAYKGKF